VGGGPLKFNKLKKISGARIKEKRSQSKDQKEPGEDNKTFKRKDADQRSTRWGEKDGGGNGTKSSRKGGTTPHQEIKRSHKWNLKNEVTNEQNCLLPEGVKKEELLGERVLVHWGGEGSHKQKRRAVVEKKK